MEPPTKHSRRQSNPDDVAGNIIFEIATQIVHSGVQPENSSYNLGASARSDEFMVSLNTFFGLKIEFPLFFVHN